MLPEKTYLDEPAPFCLKWVLLATLLRVVRDVRDVKAVRAAVLTSLALYDS